MFLNVFITHLIVVNTKVFKYLLFKVWVSSQLKFLVRRIQAEDEDRAVIFYANLFRGGLSGPGINGADALRRGRERIQVATQRGNGFVGVLGANPQGYVVYDFDSRGLHVDHLYVREMFQGNGLGRALLSDVAYEATRLCKPIVLNLPSRASPHHQGARKFYERLGFQYFEEKGVGKMILEADRVAGIII